MLKRKFIGERVITSALVLLLLPGTSLRIAGAEPRDAPPRGIAVYVRDFAFFVALAAAPDPPNPAHTDTPPEPLQLGSRQVQNYFAETLVETLRTQGYSSSRNQALPGKGVLLEGVVAEPDQKNRIRRALLGTGAHSTNLMLYVGVFDEKSVSQPLYVEAPCRSPTPITGQ